jgi:ubiquinone/menaquinone biosynthesis C-methylase UbiE
MTDNPPNPKDYWSNRSGAWTAGASTGKATDETFDRALIDAAAITPGTRVLDLAAGTGDPTMTIAQHLKGAGSVTAFDMTGAMLSVAQRRAENLGLDNVSIISGNMEYLPFPDSSFDAITCRNGLMFPDDKLACVREARRVLKPGARAAWLVWATIEENPTFLTVNQGLRAYFGKPFPPRMVRHTLGNEGALTALLRNAGFSKVDEKRFSYERVVAVGDDYFRRSIARTVPNEIGVLADSDWVELIAAVETASAALRDGDVFRIPVVARLGIGTR